MDRALNSGLVCSEMTLENVRAAGKHSPSDPHYLRVRSAKTSKSYVSRSELRFWAGWDKGRGKEKTI